ncbi:hypothetical protein SprV_0401631700 [Sparganum proliferum]
MIFLKVGLIGSILDDFPDFNVTRKHGNITVQSIYTISDEKEKEYELPRAMVGFPPSSTELPNSSGEMTSEPDKAYAPSLPIEETKSPILPGTSLQSSKVAPMQVAQKESSSGFMLLSVKHHSRKRSDRYPCYSQAAALEPCLDDSCIARSSPDLNHRGARGNSCEYGRSQFTSTASLEAEEYDDEEDGTSSHSEPNEGALGADVPLSSVRKSSMVYPHSDLVQIAQAKRLGYVNGRLSTPQSAGLLTPVAVSAFPSDLVGQSVQSDGWTVSNNALLPGVRATVSTPGARTSDCTPLPLNVQPPQPADRRPPADRQSDLTPEEVEGPSNLPCTRQPLRPSTMDADTPCNINPSEPRPTDYQSFSNIPSNIYVKSSVPNQKTESPIPRDFVPQTLPFTPSMQSVIQATSETANEPLRPSSDTQNARSSIFSALSVLLQPASRFRKTRIRETVEQWNSNRLCLHDCRLKAVPDWVSDLSTKPDAFSQDHIIVEQGRCVYCFVPSGAGGQCAKKQHRVSSRFSPANEGVAPNQEPSQPLSESAFTHHSLISGFLQAAAAAYQTCSMQGYNTRSLTSAWDNGLRVPSSISPGHLGLPRRPLIGKHLRGRASSDSEPPIVAAAFHHNEEEDAVAGPSNPTSFTPGHQSDLTEMFEGRSTATLHLGIASTSTDTASAQSSEELESATQMRVTKGGTAKITDPSAAYLRRYASERQQSQFGSDDQICSICTKDPAHTNVLGRASSLGPDYDAHRPQPSITADEDVAELAEKSNISETQFAPPASPVGGSRTAQLPSTSAGTTGPAEKNTDEPFKFPYARIQPVLSEFLEKEGAPLLDIKKLLCSSCLSYWILFVSFVANKPRSPSCQEFSQSRFRPCQDSESSSDTVPKPQSSSVCDNANLVAIDRVQSENKIAGHSERASSMGPSSTLPDRPSMPPAPTLPPELNRPGQDELQATTSQQQQQLTERVESRLLQSMDVIGLAIVNTFRNELLHLISENTDLRAQQQNLVYENLSLQCYQRAFQELQGYIPVDLWERLNTRVQLEIQQVLQAAVLDVQARSAPPVSQFVQQPQQTLPAQQPQQQHDQLASVLELLVNLGQGGVGAAQTSSASTLGILQNRSQSPLQHPPTPIAQVLPGSSLASSVLPPATSCSQQTQVHLLSTAPPLQQVPEQPYPQSPSAAAAAAQIHFPASSAETMNPSLPTNSSPVHHQLIDCNAALIPPTSVVTGALPNPASAPAPPSEK